MKVTFIGHASILVEAHGLSILSDPWWRGPCFGAQWWTYPAPHSSRLIDRSIDYIYISHGHHDHLHPGTLRTLRRDGLKILVSRHVDIGSSLRELGFEVIELDEDELDFGGLKVRILKTHGHDTLMVVDDGKEVCVNLNDSLHSAPHEVQTEFVARLRRLYPRLDYVFCGYGVASHFPNCYELPAKDREATVAKRQRYFNRSWATLIAGLGPKFGFPFAADVVFLDDDLFWANEPTHNSERPTDAFHSLFPRSRVKTLDIAPGFTMENGIVLDMSLRSPVLEATLRSEYANEIARANRCAPATEEDVEEVLRLMERNLEHCEAHLRSYPGDYRFLIQFRNSSWGIRVEKQDTRISLLLESAESASQNRYDLTYRTRLPYLKRSLTAPYGDEILFVGSGGIFRYPDRALAKRHLHRELRVAMTKHSEPVAPRKQPPSGYLRIPKAFAKRALGRHTEDLYDLHRWTVFR
jgi:hypothetical protein